MNQEIQEKTQEENFLPAISIGKSKSDGQKKQIGRMFKHNIKLSLFSDSQEEVYKDKLKKLVMGK